MCIGKMWRMAIPSLNDDEIIDYNSQTMIEDKTDEDF